jgi:hypothetical protein
MSRLRFGEVLAFVAGAVLLVSLFLPWYAPELGPLSPAAERAYSQIGGDISGWEAFSITDLLVLVTALLAIAPAPLALTRRSPTLPVAAAVFCVLFALVTLIVVASRLLNQPGDNDLVGVEYGAWVGLLATLGAFAGAWVGLREEGTGRPDSLAQAADLVERGGPRRPVPPARPA